jgi:hypothetical protein
VPPDRPTVLLGPVEEVVRWALRGAADGLDVRDAPHGDPLVEVVRRSRAQAVVVPHDDAQALAQSISPSVLVLGVSARARTVIASRGDLTTVLDDPTPAEVLNLVALSDEPGHLSHPRQIGHMESR